MEVDHEGQGGLDLRCPPEIMAMTPAVNSGLCLCGLPRQVCHRYRDSYRGTGPEFPHESNDEENGKAKARQIVLEAIAKVKVDESYDSSYDPSKRQGRLWEPCFQLRNLLMDIQSFYWQRQKVTRKMKRMILPAVIKAVTRREGMQYDAENLQDFLVQHLDRLFSEERENHVKS